MNGPHIIELNRRELADAIQAHGIEQPAFRPLNINPWLAMSLLQKAIRRGRVDWALRAAATLFRISPDRVWRRLCITAYEDIGVGDFDTVAIVTAAMAGKRFRADLGGEWPVAAHLIQRMCRTVKCRAADDLVVTCEWHPDGEQARDELATMALPELIDVAISSASMTLRGLAL